MLSFVTTAIYVFGYLITIASGECPYVANYYYDNYTLGCGATSCSSYSSGSAFVIDSCQEDTFDGIGEKFVCINDEVYMNLYESTSCDGEASESHKVLPVSEYNPDYARAAYQYSCSDTGCTNYAKILVSQSSYNALVAAADNEESFPDCTNPGVEDWFDLYGISFITGICVDSTGNATDPESSMKFGCDASSFTLYRYTNDRTCSTTPEVQTHSLPGCTELAPGVEVWATIVCGDSGTNTDLLPTDAPNTSPTDEPTAKPTISPSEATQDPTLSPSEDPTRSSGAPTAAPSALTDDPTTAPSKAPSTPTADPSVSPSANPSVRSTQDSADSRGAAMILRCIWSFFMVATVTWICL